MSVAAFRPFGACGVAGELPVGGGTSGQIQASGENAVVTSMAVWPPSRPLRGIHFETRTRKRHRSCRRKREGTQQGRTPVGRTPAQAAYVARANLGRAAGRAALGHEMWK